MRYIFNTKMVIIREYDNWKEMYMNENVLVFLTVQFISKALVSKVLNICISTCLPM